MKKSKVIKRFGLLAILLTFGTMFSGEKEHQNKEQEIQLGVSEINITPQSAIRMGGYGARKGPSTGVNDELYASAMFFSGEETKILIITADLISLNDEFINEAKKIISSKISIPVENIMISATHNHGSPATYTLKDEESSAVKKYLEVLKEKFAILSVEASRKVGPFRMGIGKGESWMNINRRAKFADGSIGLGRNQKGPADHELGVVLFEDKNNNILATYINWPCHATAGGSMNNLITGDWPASVARHIENLADKDIVVAITAGASGDINPIYGPGNSFDEIEAIGLDVATEAWKVLTEIETYPVTSIQAEETTIKFPGKMRTNNRLPQTSYEKGAEVELRLTAVKIGDLVLAGVSGELFTEIGMEVKKKSPYANTFIVTHCNGADGYIITDAAYSEGGYEAGASWLMPGVEKPLIDTWVKLIRSLL